MIVIDEVSTMKAITAKEFNVAAINSIENSHPDLRQNSKGPTFA